MKTKAHKLIVTAAVALMSLTLSAQNTKSLYAAHHTEKSPSFVSKKMENLSHELSIQTKKLEAMLRYSPEVIGYEAYEMDVPFDFSSIQDTLAKDARFFPSVINYNDGAMEMKSILDELKSTIKFNASQNNEKLQLIELLSELEKDVRFYPSHTI
jgi:hypothetical protein